MTHINAGPQLHKAQIQLIRADQGIVALSAALKSAKVEHVPALAAMNKKLKAADDAISARLPSTATTPPTTASPRRCLRSPCRRQPSCNPISADYLPFSPSKAAESQSQVSLAVYADGIVKPKYEH
jgi:hypothetical protein